MRVGTEILSVKWPYRTSQSNTCLSYVHVEIYVRIYQVFLSPTETWLRSYQGLVLFPGTLPDACLMLNIDTDC